MGKLPPEARITEKGMNANGQHDDVRHRSAINCCTTKKLDLSLLTRRLFRHVTPP
jgi:hypothetical protein